MVAALEYVSPYAAMELLWDSPRELLNIFQANDIGCDIVTATDSVLSKLKIVGKDLDQYSLDGPDVLQRRRSIGIQTSIRKARTWAVCT